MSEQSPYREPPVPVPPSPQPEISWLGTKRFWLVGLGLFLAISIGLVAQMIRVAHPSSLVAVVSLSGPSEAAPGDKVRYGALVRDTWGAAVPHARVRIGTDFHGFHELARGETGDDGSVNLEVTFPERFEGPEPISAIADVGVADARATVIVEKRRPASGYILISTDKPIYQPGQTMHVRALAMAGTTPVANRAVTVEIRTPDGTRVFKEPRTTSAFGVLSADFPLAEQVKLGFYTIRISAEPLEGKPSDPGIDAASTPVEVKRYSLPKLKVALEDVGALRAAAPLEGTAKATWIFGEPVTSGSVVVGLSHGGSAERSVRGQLDKEGKFHFVLPPPEKKGDTSASGSFTLRASVELEGGLHAETTMPMEQFGPGGIKLEAFPESGTLVGLVEQTVFAVVTGNVRENVEVAVEGGPAVKTDAHGIARVTVRPADPNVKLRATGPNGETATAEMYAQKQGLVIRPDHESYEAGAASRVRLVGAAAGDRVAVRLMKGVTPLLTGTCIVASAADGCEVPFTMPISASGLVWIQALTMPAERGREILTSKRLIMVDGGGRDLTLKVSSDKPVYAPRDEGTVTVDVTGAGGKPAKAGVGVTVADEAVFALADVRPDLERQFFVIDPDYRDARRPYQRGVGRSSSERDVPPQFDRQAVYDPSTASSVRAAILAVLTTMPEPDVLPFATSSDLRSRVTTAREEQNARLRAWWVLVVAATSLAALVLFGVYGILRLRHRVPSAVPESYREAFRIEMRGLLTDWLVAVLVPIALTPLALAGAELFTGRHSYSSGEHTVFGSWAVLALVGSWVLLRGALRVRRTPVATDVPTLRRSVMLLPAAALFGQLAVLLVVGGGAGRVSMLFDTRNSPYFIVLLVVLGVQLAFGFLSVIRQTLARPVTGRRAVWLLLSRATFIGLPVTLGFFVYFGVRVARDYRTSFAEYQQEETPSEAADTSSDNKEGGTGTRAKGEEGSMGNPKPGGGSNKRYGVQGESASAGKRPEGVVRDWFPETLLWAPEIATDDAGHLSFKVPFADSITTWRLGLRAVSSTGQIGASTTPLVVKQDFFVDASLPAMLTQGDELAVPVTVFSYLERAQDVSVDLEGDGMSAVGQGHVSLHLEPKEARGMRFTVRADKAGERLVRIKASTASRADVEERKVIVTPNGKERVQTMNARLVKEATSEVTLPEGAIEGGNDLYAKIYGGPLSQVGEGLDGVFQMPHGCFEQTSSTTYPSILVLDFLKRTQQVSPEIEKKARGYLGQGYQRLLSFEVSGGGFSLFGNQPADVALSSYGLLELADMARVTGSVDEDLLKRTSRFILSKRSPNGKWITVTRDAWDRPKENDALLLTAYAAWALATAAALEKTPDPKVNEVLDVVHNLAGDEAEDSYGLTLRVNALLAGGRNDAAKVLAERLAARAIRDDEGVHWGSSQSGVLYSYGSSLEVEVTGLATHALALAGLHPELRAGALDWLVRRRGARGTWSTTQATIAAMRAMLDEAKPTPKASQDVTLVVDGTPAGSIRLEPAARDVHHLVDLRRFASTGKHTIELKSTGDADVSYQLVTTHWVPWKTPERGSLGLDVSYASTAIAPGSTTLLKARLTWSGKLPAVMPLVEIPIPPSFDVETDDLEALLKDPDGIQRYTVGGGKITLYVTAIRADKPLTVGVRLRALRSAKVVAPASVAYLYYEPEVRTESAPVLVRAL
ncbi:MAG: alpha-2-macroglobulin family protein [Labilithrix sp.]